MKFYILSQKQEPGCPLGMLGGILRAGFAPDAHKTEYGRQPWYADPSGGRPHRPFPDGLVFITKDKHYGFDLRSDSKFFYLASNELIEACDGLDVRFEDRQRIEVVSRQGKPVADKQYWVCRFQPVTLADAVDAAGSMLESSDGVHTQIRRLRIRTDFPQDLFKLARLDPAIDAMFCSQRFYDRALTLGLRGITFSDVETFAWPAPLSFEQSLMQGLTGGPVLHVI